MINVYKNLASNPTVYVAVPPKVYSTLTNPDGNYGINKSIMTSDVDPLIRQAASETYYSIIDNYSATLNMPDNFPDAVHPNDNGAFAIPTILIKA